jgi:hypothetical protein
MRRDAIAWLGESPKIRTTPASGSLRPRIMSMVLDLPIRSVGARQRSLWSYLQVDASYRLDGTEALCETGQLDPTSGAVRGHLSST